MKVKKRETTKNYEVEHFRKPPKKNIKKDEDGDLKYRTKEIIDKDGKKHLVRFVIMKKKGKRGGTTRMTSLMHQKEGYVSKIFINECMSKVYNDPFDQSRSLQKDIEMLRTAIIAELDAANLYEQMAAQASTDLVRRIMLDIAREEKVHIGEFEVLLEDLDTDHEEAEEEGEEEVMELIERDKMKDISKNYIELNENSGLGLLALFLTLIIAVAIKAGFDRRAAEKIANELLPIIKKDLDAGIKKAAPKIAAIGLELYKTIISRNEWKTLLKNRIFWGLDDWKKLIQKNKYEEFLQLYVSRSMKTALYMSKGKRTEEVGLQNFFTRHFGMVTMDDTYEAVYRYVKYTKGVPENSPTFELLISNTMKEVDNMENEVLKADDKASKILKPIYKLFFDNLGKLLKQKAKELT